MFSRFDTILACERQTDGRTDGAEHRVVKKTKSYKIFAECFLLRKY